MFKFDSFWRSTRWICHYSNSGGGRSKTSNFVISELKYGSNVQRQEQQKQGKCARGNSSKSIVSKLQDGLRISGISNA